VDGRPEEGQPVPEEVAQWMGSRRGGRTAGAEEREDEGAGRERGRGRGV
jgi:hypothetical protein